MTEVLFRAEARLDVLETYRWYESKRSGLGSEFRSSLRATVERIAKHPTTYAPGYRQLRRALVARFPYAVHFRILDDIVVVVAVLHFRRHPSIAQAR